MDFPLKVSVWQLKTGKNMTDDHTFCDLMGSLKADLIITLIQSVIKKNLRYSSEIYLPIRMLPGEG